MKRRRSSSVIVATAASFCLLLPGCGKRQTAADSGIRDQVLHLGNQSEPKDLDPHIVTGIPEYNIVSALFEGLVAENPKDLSPEPATAESWTVSPDGRLYTFRIRPAARWSNGDPVTAGDFVFSFERMLTPALASPYAYMLYAITNAEAFHRGALRDFSAVGVYAPSPGVLEIRLAHPVPHFLAMLSHNSWYPVHPPTIRRFDAMQRGQSTWTQPGALVGNGPFSLAAWAPNDRIVVRRNTNYWDHALVRLNEIHFHTVGDHQIEERAFRAGQLHVTGTVPIDRVEHYRSQQPEILRLDPYLATYFYIFNVRRKPLDDPRVRRAFSLAVDREQLVKYVTRAGETAATRFTPDMPGYAPDLRVDFNPAEARRQLAEAGFPEGRGFPRLEFLYNTSDAQARIAQAVQQMWKQNLGIDIALVNMEWKTYLEATQSGNYDISRASWFADYVDPSTFLDLMVTGGGNNRTGWSDPRYDRLIRQAAEAADPAARGKLLAEAEALLLQECPLMPLYYGRSKALVHPAVRNWHPTILNHQAYKYVYLDTAAP